MIKSYGKKGLLEIKKENKKELHSVSKDYIKTYLKSLLLNPNSYNSRKDLIHYILEYCLIVKEENKYINYIINNFNNIRNEETLINILDDLGFIGKKTYQHHQDILSYCKSLTNKKSGLNIKVERNFSTLLESTTYLEEIKGLFLSEKDLYNYYQHEDAYYYLKEHNKTIDIPIEIGLQSFGCFYETDDELISSISLCTPNITDLTTMLINVREYKSGIILYSHLGKKIPQTNLDIEASKEEDKFIKKYLLKK